MIELIHFDAGGEYIPGPDVRASTFGNVGFIVPDPRVAEQRLKEYGATVYKGVGEDMPTSGPLGRPEVLGDARGLSEEAWRDIQREMSTLNRANVFAADPDGNLIEVLPVVEPDLFR